MPQQQLIGSEALQQVLEELKDRENDTRTSIPSPATVTTCEDIIDELI